MTERDPGNNLAASATQVEVVPAPKHTRVGYGWYVGATFYPYDGGYPDFGFYGTSEDDGYPPGSPPTDNPPTTPGDTGAAAE